MKLYFDKVMEKMQKEPYIDSFNFAYYMGYIHALGLAQLLSWEEEQELLEYREQRRNEYLQSIAQS